MIVAHALTVLKLGREWRLKSDEPNEDIRNIIRLFEDCEGAPLGMHSLINTAVEKGFNNPIGQWYSPSQALCLIRDTINYSNHPELKQIKALVAIDNCLAKNDVRVLSDNWKKSMIIFLCLRLGTKLINPVYFDQLRAIFTLEATLGIIGGRPKHAVYFIGFHDEKFYCLDPHTSQKYKNLNTNDDPIWQTFHCHFEPSYMKINELDPSCAIGFLVKNENEFNELIDSLVQNNLIEIPKFKLEEESNKFSKLFTVVDRKPSFSSPALRKLSYESDVTDFEIV